MKIKEHLDPIFKIVADNVRTRYNNHNEIVVSENSDILVYNLHTCDEDKDVIYNSKLDKYIELKHNTYIIDLCGNIPYLYKATEFLGWGYPNNIFMRKLIPLNLANMKISISQIIRDLYAHICDNSDIRDTLRNDRFEIVCKTFYFIIMCISAGVLCNSLILLIIGFIT